MYQLAGEEQVQALLEYFEQDLKNCLYSYIDLKKYGIKNPHLRIFYSAREGKIRAAATEYYKGIQLVSHGDELDVPETLELIERLNAPMINGRWELIQKLEPYLKERFETEKGYVAWMKELRPGASWEGVEQAGEEDCLEIARLICTDEGLGGHYEPGELAGQMADRQREGFGRNMVIRDHGKIASHAATYAEIPNLAIVSGVITQEDYRGQGLGYRTVSKLCKDLLQEGKRPCIFYFKKEAEGLYKKVGFEEGTGWGKLSRRHNRYYVNPYIRDCVRVFPEQGRYGRKRYDMNENPEGLPKEFVDRVLKEITPEFLAIYPEPDRFLEKYAAHIGMKKENLCATNGSDMAIRFLMEVFSREGGQVVTVAPSFEMYWVNCSMLGRRHVPVDLEPDFTVPVEKLMEAITEETDLVVLVNPNNPVGHGYSLEDGRRLAEKARECGAILHVDEAYHYFQKASLLPLVEEFDNVVVTRTFSKLFSMAALRLGVVISNPQMIGYLKKATPSFEVNAVALLFAERALEEPGLIEELIRKEAEGKAYVVNTLREKGYEAFAEAGNFIFVKPKREISRLMESLERRQVLVKAYGNEMLKDYLRISTGSRAAMERYIREFLEAEEEE
ncbi:MAG: aminotransferase class I/II-fold pyridoxal phosphate-dependent enzyme [Lachnospiraceae bacterium]|nr:aminotransferase class I/II-fold pyridoxal phosphate-dependent enzyme [Lachnospiraceae bacterium]